MSSPIGEGEEEGELGGVVQRVGGEFVEGMSIDEAFSVGVVSPMGLGIFEPSGTGTLFLAGASFVAVGVGPGFDFGAISCDVEVLPGDHSHPCGVLYGAGFEDRVDASLSR